MTTEQTQQDVAGTGDAVEEVVVPEFNLPTIEVEAPVEEIAAPPVPEPEPPVEEVAPTEEILVVMPDESAAPMPVKTFDKLLREVAKEVAQTVSQPDEPTFAELLQTAIAQFSTDVSALTALDAGVSQSTADRAAAEAAMDSAVAAQGSKISERDSGQSVAIASRDSLVSVLQSWIP